MSRPISATADAARHRRLPRSAYSRLLEIARALAKAGWAHYIGRLHLPHGTGVDAPSASAQGASAAQLREAIESLGPTFVKFGQLLSTRRDMLPDVYVEELTKLQDQVSAGTETEARPIVEAELGRTLEDAFASFDEAPFAAASMALVYDATLPDGASAVVKVQRAGIVELIHTDLDIMGFLARQLERYVPESRRFSPTELVDEFAQTIEGELDFTREGRNADRFRENFREDGSVVVPIIYWERTSPRVLTMERSPGRRAPPFDPSHAGMGHAYADTLMRLFLTQVFEHGFFHGDPHPGNVFLLDDGRLCFHDFGIVGELVTRDREELAELMLAVTSRDAAWVTDAYFAMGVVGDDVDRPAFTRDIDDALQALYANAGQGPAFSEILRQFMRLGQRHRVRLPRTFLSVAKAFMEIESQALQLDPTFDAMGVLQRRAPQIFWRLVLRRPDGASAKRSTFRDLLAVRRALNELPQIAAHLVDALRSGKFNLTVRHEQLEDLEEHIERASNRLSFSMIIASVVIGSAILVSFHAGPHLQGAPLLGLAGFVIAGVLGLWWAVATLRSGRL
jgi:ubiquinone biosynthesis protein